MDSHSQIPAHPRTRDLWPSFLGALAAVWLLAASGHAAAVNKGAILLLAAKGANGQIVSTGTGFVIDPEGLVVTNYHVLVDAASMEGVFPNGTRVSIQGVRALDRTKDFALLQLEKSFYSTLELGDSAGLKEFAYTTALGFPSQAVQGESGDLSGTLVQTHGFVLGIHPQAFPGFSFIYTTTPFGPGFSGGPVLDQDNKVVGLATLEGRAINLALPINEVKPHLKSKSLVPFAQLLEEDKASKEAMYYKGNFALYGLGEPKTAIRLFEQALVQDPQFFPARYDLAVAYRGLGQENQAIAEYQKILEHHPRFPEALSNLGGQFFRKGETDKAIGNFQKAIEVYPNFIQALSNLGAALNKQGHYQKALPHLKRSVELDPDFAVAYFNLGNSYFGMEQYAQAEQAFNTAVNRGVDFLSLHWKLMEINLKGGKKEEAIRELNLILEMDPLNKEASDKLNDLKSGAR